MAKVSERFGMNLTPDETKRFIKMVADHPALYNPTDINYRDQLLKETIWGGIGQSFNRNSENCKKCWRNLKDSYIRFKRKYKDTGRVEKINWPMYQLMSFLENIVAEKSRSNNSEANVPETKEDSSNNPVVFGIEHIIFNKPINLFQPDSHLTKPRTSKKKIPDPLQTIKEPDSIPLVNHRISITSNVTTYPNSSMIVKEPESILPDTNSPDDAIDTAKEIKFTENTIPSVVKRRRRLDEEQGGSLNDTTTRVTSTINYVTNDNVTSDDSNTHSVVPSIKEEACEEDRTTACFLQHVKEVLNKLPPTLRVQAQQDMFMVLTKYELSASETISDSFSSIDPNILPSLPAKRIKRDSTSFDLDVEIKAESNVFDNFLDIAEESS